MIGTLTPDLQAAINGALAQEADTRISKAVEALAANGVAMTRLCDNGIAAMPRMMIGAAIRNVEMLANHPDDERREVAVLAAQDLLDALKDATRAIEGLLTLLDDAGSEGEGSRPS